MPATCPESWSCTDDCGGALAGAIVASLLIGLVVGALAMYLAQRYSKKRKMGIPPKDYSEADTSALDVNMNNGESTASPADTGATTQAQPQVKGHKKLERLSKQGPKPIPAPKPTILGLKTKPNERCSVETPLIYIGPRTNDGDNNLEALPSGDKNDSSKSVHPHQTVGSLSGDDDNGGNGDNDDDNEDDGLYTNIGLDAAMSQPYDSLDVIPEEVEYANTQEYEELGLVSRG
ncbi:hypothetical protein PoB_007561000 [Plakobranchus ocellatus]|uniref:Uncharacterized protein n=1 Tax=Plakobranchus ocellatus TaxID=259542 RepID=A0AAV4DY28_9GAST|nr:hypothetical protein PoB_007561000 [Plakobranchus ocellatus]